MAQVDLAYGPPGHRGVTELMTVGDVLDTTSYVRQVKTYGAILAAGVGVYGLATGKKKTSVVGGLAALALWLAR